MLIIRRLILHYTASGIITPIGGCLVHRLREDLWLITEINTYTEMHGPINLRKQINPKFLVYIPGKGSLSGGGLRFFISVFNKSDA